jgi:twitching motility protein PilI
LSRSASALAPASSFEARRIAMADNEALQHRLQASQGERLQMRAQPPVASWLAVECAGHGLLLPLGEAGQIHAMTAVVPVAHAKAWFLGVAHLRTGLHGVVDLAAFLGLERLQRGRDEARLVAFNATLEINCVLLVDRLAGLRSAGQLTASAQPVAALPPFVGKRFRDDGGRHWQELHLSALARDDAFLAIVA